LRETSVHSGGTNELTYTFRAFRCHWIPCQTDPKKRINWPLLSVEQVRLLWGQRPRSFPQLRAG
jgi:hypothetical protein